MYAQREKKAVKSSRVESKDRREGRRGVVLPAPHERRGGGYIQRTTLGRRRMKPLLPTGRPFFCSVGAVHRLQLSIGGVAPNAPLKPPKPSMWTPSTGPSRLGVDWPELLEPDE